MKHRIYRWLWLFGMVFLLTGCGPYFPALLERPEVQASAPDVLALTGNVENGRALFMGSAHFEHEGPPCMGCHSVGDNGILGGGVMGPNLTDIVAERSQTEILAVFASAPDSLSPVMKPIYTDAPLTAQEQADLLAFLQAAKDQPETDKEFWIFGISLAGTVGGIALIGFVYRGRLRSVRRALVEKAQAENQ
jgi:hypothetical protein